MPKVPILAGLNRRSLQLSSAEPKGIPRPDADVRHFTRGRYALTHAYRQSGVGPQGSLLAPAYHCRTMLDPALRLGACVALYKVNPDLSPDMDSLMAQVNSVHQPLSALLVPHYFGFPQKLAPLAAFCEQHGLVLIEDCSHALVGAGENPTQKSGAMGATGRFCVSSPYKFFPTPDGGLLWANGIGKLPDFVKSSLRLVREIKGLAQSLQNAFGKVQPLNVNELHSEVHAMTEASFTMGFEIDERSESPSTHYDIAQEGLPSLITSRWMFRHIDCADLVNRRRENYAAWIEGTSQLPHCRALYPKLVDGCAPYMFPLQIDCPEIHFYALKQLGVPVWRWDEIAVSGCPIAADFRLKLLHLPCHQSLSSKQMEWMIAAVSQVMRQLPVGTRS
jgi:perosamine synthetase